MTSGHASDASVVVQITDLHYEQGAAEAECAAALGAALKAIDDLDEPVAAVLFTGDLVDEPGAEAYAGLRALLEACGPPVLALPGNHDDRALLRHAFAPADPPGAAPVSVRQDAGGWVVLGCDSTVPGHGHGTLSADQLDWLDAELAACAGAPVLLGLHHPPILTGAPVLDALALDRPSAEGLARVAAAHPHLQLVTCGHAHRTGVGAIGGCPVLICPSVRFQLEPDPGAPGGLVRTAAPPGMAVHRLADGRIAGQVVTLPPLL